MRTFLFFVSIMMSGWSLAQTIKGKVVDSLQKPVEFAEVIDVISKQQSLTDELGNFELIVKDSFALEITHPQFTSEFFELQQTSEYTERSYVLSGRIQLVDEVVISSERMKTVVDQRNINVIDYFPFDNSLLVLKSHKGRRLLSIEGSDTTYLTVEIGKLKPRKIYLDCFENIHLLSDDSAYQIAIDTSLLIVSRSSIPEFEYSVMPCVADYEHTRVFGDFSNHNKKYTLTSIHQETGAKDHFLHIHDEVAEDVARTCYSEIIGHYFAVTPEHQNVILNKVWSGNLMDLQSLDNRLDQMITWYLKIRSTELTVQSFQYNNWLINVDQYSDSVRVFNKNNELIHSKQHDFHESSRVHDALLDRATGAIYEQFSENGVYSVREIAITQNAASRQLTLSEAPFCKNIRVHDDWVYFMVQENSFYQINRIYLGNK